MRTQELTTNGIFNSTLLTNLSVANRHSKSILSVLVSFAFVAVVAILIVDVGIGICQYNSSEKYFLNDSSFANQTWCNGLDVLVFSQDHQDHWIACEGARDALVFLGNHGLDVTDTIVIEQLTKLPDDAGDSAAGCYLESERRVMILVYSEFKRFGTWFRAPIDRSLYRSAVSHEVAHAVADLNFTISKPSIQAKEYIAYITQFSTMEPELRDRVLANFSDTAFEGEWQMNTTIYMFDPMGFGIRAYLHFLNLIDGNEYLHSILNGETLMNTQYIY